MGTKTFKSSPDSPSGIVVSENATRINGNKDNFVLTDESGTTINGPISFPAGASQIRYAGMWTMNTEMILSLPSTMATPSPVMTINPPIKQFTSLMGQAAGMMALIGALNA
jgi:hypothetical protein